MFMLFFLSQIDCLQFFVEGYYGPFVAYDFFLLLVLQSTILDSRIEPEESPYCPGRLGLVEASILHDIFFCGLRKLLSLLVAAIVSDHASF